MKYTKLTIAITASLAAMGSLSSRATPLNLENAPKAAEIRIVEVFGDANVSIEAADGSAPNTAKSSKNISSYSWSNGPQVFAFSPDGGDVNVFVSNAISQAFSSGASGGMIGGLQIKNAPYSAEVISERTQTLPDGNQITKRNSQLSFRDSAGRTRTEMRDDNGETRSINIFDAVEGHRFVLVPKTKVANKMTIDRDLQKRVSELREKAKSMAKDGKSTIVERSPGEEVMITRVESPGKDGGKELREEVKVSVIRTSGDAKVESDKNGEMMIRGSTLKGLPPLNMSMQGIDFGALGPLNNTFQDREWIKKSTTKDLGVKDIEGVRVEGKLRSYTIPTGEIGNKNAIVVSTETWYSPELQVTVYSKHSDPRAGDTVYRLANIKRSEPALALFNVPDGYTVKESPTRAVELKAK